MSLRDLFSQSIIRISINGFRFDFLILCFPPFSRLLSSNSDFLLLPSYNSLSCILSKIMIKERGTIFCAKLLKASRSQALIIIFNDYGQPDIVTMEDTQSTGGSHTQPIKSKTQEKQQSGRHRQVHTQETQLQHFQIGLLKQG